jgi:hypothetical protein
VRAGVRTGVARGARVDTEFTVFSSRATAREWLLPQPYNGAHDGRCASVDVEVQSTCPGYE